MYLLKKIIITSRRRLCN